MIGGSVRIRPPRLLLGAAVLVTWASAAQPALAQTDLNRTIEQFDEVRALGMRALLRAQELKTAYLYGRGFGLRMPEYIAEDMLIEGMWLFDYLHSMDSTSMSLICYAAAAEHPNLEQELALFRAYLAEAARKTADYYDRVSKALAQAVARVNAAAARKAPFHLETIPAQPPADDPATRASAGDGFNLGWAWPVIQDESTKLGRHLEQHGYAQDRLFRLALKAGVEFIRPDDRNLFDWIDVEKQDGDYDWSRIDKLLAVYKRYDMALWLVIPSSCTSPPQWLTDRLKNAAVLTGRDGQPLSTGATRWDRGTGIRDMREQNNPPNLFNPVVGRLFGRYVRQLLAHVRQSGVRIIAVEIGDSSGLPFYCGPEAHQRWWAWLEKNKIDPRERWNMDIGVREAILPDALRTAGVTDPGKRRMLADIQRWREDEYIEYFRGQVDAVRAAAPELPIYGRSCSPHQGNESMDGRPDERVARELGLVPFAGASGSSVWDDLRRCYSPGGWPAMLTHTSWWGSPSQYSFSSYIHGTLTVMSPPTPVLRGFHWGNSFWYPDLRWRWSSLGGWRRFHERAQGMAPEIANTKPAPQVAVLWSCSTNKYQSFISDYVRWAGPAYRDRANYHKIGCIGWNRILNCLCLSNDFITEDQVRRGGLRQYQMLIMPAVQALPADVAEQIRRNARNGGKVVATSAPALFGDDMQQKGAGQLADLFGADFDCFLGKSGVAGTPMGITLIDQPRLEYWNGPNREKAGARSDSLRTLYCTFTPRAGASVLHRFTTGEPAVLLNSPGDGKAVVIGYPIGRESFLSDVYQEDEGHTWSAWPNGSTFQQGLFRWFELLLPKLGFVRDAVVSEELVPRPVGQDAGWPCWQWTRKGGGYRDYVWKGGRLPGTGAARQEGDAAPRSVELAFRRREGNPNLYLTVLNREGGYGLDPGLTHFEATSKEIKIELARGNVHHIYDLSLGCRVPFKIQWSGPGFRTRATTFRTMIEPSMARMFIIAIDDGTIRTYSGNRRHGRSDDEIRRNVGRLMTGDPVPEHVVIGPADVINFLVGRAMRGITISAESPLYLPAAERLAAALERAPGRKVRITRNSPRIQGSHKGQNVWRSDGYISIEEPDILLGSHNESHYIAAQRVHPQLGHYGHHQSHTARLPIMTSHTFPGPGRSVIMLLRPFQKRGAYGNEALRRVSVEEPAEPKLVIGASGPRGLQAGVENLITLIRKAKQ